MKGKSLLSDVSWNHLSLSGDRVFLWVAGARTCTLVDVQKSSSLVLTEWVWIHSSLESANPGLLPTLTWPLGKAYSYILWLIAWNSKGKLWSDDLWVLCFLCQLKDLYVVGMFSLIHLQKFREKKDETVKGISDHFLTSHLTPWLNYTK